MIEVTDDEDEEPYCTNCGSTKLRYLETYANGEEWQCVECGETTIIKPRDWKDV